MSYRYKELIVWQKAKALATAVYCVTNNYPKTELYDLTSQSRRAAVSIASNIAEGQGRLTLGEFQHFLGQARGSLLELETQLSIAVDLQYIPEHEFEDMENRISEVRRLLNGLIDSLHSRKVAACS